MAHNQHQVSRSRKVRISPAMVIACVALLVALGGGAYAAFKLPKNSVGTKQIKNDAVTGAKVKDGSLKPADVGNVVARARGTGDVTTSQGTTADYPLSKGAWTQGANEPDELVATVSYTTPTSCSSFGGIGFGNVNINDAGNQVISVALATGPASTTRTSTVSGFLFEPGSSTHRNLTATASGGCSGAGEGFVVHSVAVDVIGFG
jgi:hypothetical protein